jgi:hypothetical protein
MVVIFCGVLGLFLVEKFCSFLARFHILNRF